ncbi:MoaD/ThiS family protein [Dyadobacter luticola]|uniref:MoaD/ThiS family protein n=1 Tax=Dyadobacter luticola TaxID=1979387 RepID=A0A5R9KRK4_9BACT|nr:MoaD/ThiS family protein [Dyadobacter luticola]TLU98902.1 MoaD/ThiS family protein [Dyadobacter luticola]
MSIHITYFGMLAEIAGQADESWIADENLTVGKFRSLLLEKYPRMGEKKFKIAVNQQISEDFVPIEMSSEVAVLPPFAGG